MKYIKLSNKQRQSRYIVSVSYIYIASYRYIVSVSYIYIVSYRYNVSYILLFPIHILYPIHFSWTQQNLLVKWLIILAAMYIFNTGQYFNLPPVQNPKVERGMYCLLSLCMERWWILEIVGTGRRKRRGRRRCIIRQVL